MAVLQWGHVYFGDRLVGILENTREGGSLFQYDVDYLAEQGRVIAHTLPLRREPYKATRGLLPFFDNLVAEGWLRDAQARALGTHPDDRFALLLAFGRDLAGAVAVIDPAPTKEPNLAATPLTLAALTARGSLSGIQPKLLVVKDEGVFRPAQSGETSTHIAKLPSGALPGLIELEHATTRMVKALLPDDSMVETQIGAIGEVADNALIVRRFDRTEEGKKRHFEEFTQLLDKPSRDKYEADYEDMAAFIRQTPGCQVLDVDRLYRRVLADVLVGNTDAHLKNFALFHTERGYRLTPAYDLVAAAAYRDFQTVALGLAGTRNRQLGQISPRTVIRLGDNMGLPRAAIELAVNDLGKRLDAAHAVIDQTTYPEQTMNQRLHDLVEKRWNGTFRLIGKQLSKKQSAAAKRKKSLKNDWQP